MRVSANIVNESGEGSNKGWRSELHVVSGKEVLKRSVIHGAMGAIEYLERASKVRGRSLLLRRNLDLRQTCPPKPAAASSFSSCHTGLFK